MEKIEILGFPASTYVRAVRMACEEKGIAYEVLPYRPHCDEINAVHPFGKIPGLRHGDFELCESRAIVTYLDRTFPGPKLIPEGAREGALVEQWISFVNTHMDRTLVRNYLLAYIFPNTPDGKPDRTKIDAVVPDVQSQIALLDKGVARTGYLGADRFTYADMNLLPILFYLRQFPEARAAIDAAPHLPGYFERHAQRPSFVNTTPPPLPQRAAA